jgi:glycosyltransferase involved in cell wall biosynthesis
MRSILHHVPNLNLESGGLSASVIQLVDSLLGRDSDLDLTLLTQCSVNSSSQSYPSKHCSRLRLMDISNLRNLDLALRPFRKQPPETQPTDRPYQLIHDHGLWLFPHHRLAKIATKHSIPRMVTPHGMLQPLVMRHRRWKKHLAWNLYQHEDLLAARVIHATSPEEAKALKQIFPGKPIALIPFGISLANLPPLKTPKPTPKGRVLFLSRLHPVKGLKYLIEAWHILQPDHWELIIAGPDEAGHQAEIEQLIDQLGITSSIHFVGAVSGDQKWQLYQSADLFVLPSLTESFGLVVVEALASGLPVITTKGTPWSQLETEGCGWWIDGGTTALVDALRQATALTHPERVTMGQRGRDLVSKQYTWEKSAEHMLSVYAWMLGSQEQPSCWFEDPCV